MQSDFLLSNAMECGWGNSMMWLENAPTMPSRELSFDQVVGLSSLISRPNMPQLMYILSRVDQADDFFCISDSHICMHCLHIYWVILTNPMLTTCILILTTWF